MDVELESEEENDELDYKIYKVEKLIERRELLLNNCLLRQNPNSVELWLKRLKIVKKDVTLLLKTYSEALTTINP